MKKKPWNIKQLWEQHKIDLQTASANNATGHEIMMIETINLKEIRDKAAEFRRTRKLTPGEISVMRTIDPWYE